VKNQSTKYRHSSANQPASFELQQFPYKTHGLRIVTDDELSNTALNPAPAG
jgi:hypothetical protein